MSEFVRIIDPSGKTLRNDLYNSPPDAVSYIIFKDGGLIKAKNGRTGQIEFSGKDAATVIQSALNALTPNRTWKETVRLKGVFEISDPIYLPSYAVLEGPAVIRQSDGANIDKLIRGYGITQSEIRNLTVDYNHANNPESKEGMYIGEQSAHVSIVNCTFKHARGFAIHFGGVPDKRNYYIKVLNNRIIDPVHPTLDMLVVVSDGGLIAHNVVLQQDANMAIVPFESYYINVIHNFVETTGAIGIAPMSCGFSIIADNIVNAMNGVGFQIATEHDNPNPTISTRNLLFGNVVNNAYVGFRLFETQNDVIQNNTISYSDNGFEFPEGNPPATGMIIRDNRLIDVNHPVINPVGADLTGVFMFNVGYPTENRGTAAFSGDGTTTDFSLGAHGLAITCLLYTSPSPRDS